MTAPSLRARKKHLQQELLLDAAAQLFRGRGFEATRIEDIAALAGVSAKTVYNYFPGKEQLIVGLLVRDRERLVDDYEGVLRQPPADPAAGLAALVRADVGDVRSAQDKRLWRELLAAETRGHERSRDGFGRNRQVFTGYVGRLLRHYVRARALSPALPVAVTADLVYAINAFDFREYCAAPSMTPATVERRARRQARVLLQGWIGAPARARR